MTGDPVTDIDLRPPDQAEVELVARGVMTAVRGPAGLTHLQQLVIPALLLSMTGYEVELPRLTDLDSDGLATGLARRNAAYRSRIVQIMVLSALIVRPLPADVVQRVRSYADALRVDDEMLDVAEEFADGALDLAQTDFTRGGYLGALEVPRVNALHTDRLDAAWGQVSDDAALADRWKQLSELPLGSIGRGVSDFYRDRGFVVPGLPDSAPPLLAQHDWVHVLAGYGTTLESEIEVFAFMARANDDPRAFSLLAMVISLFETGFLPAGAGLFEADRGHLATSGMAVRLGDAMRRGALTHGSHDFLDLDWFAIADEPITSVRDRIGIVAKAPDATAAGSAGPWEAGGITPYQLEAAKTLAVAEDREHQVWRPDPTRD